MIGMETFYFHWWKNEATEEDKYSEWSVFRSDTGSDMTYSAFCDQIDLWSANV